MNNCRKFIDKAPLVKRLSNSLLRPSDEYRPLLNGNNFSTTNNYLSSSTAHITSKNDDIIGTTINNDDAMLCDANEMIASKFGDSCRKSLTSVLLDNRRTKDYCEFDFKQNFLRETSSGKSFVLYSIKFVNFLFRVDSIRFNYRFLFFLTRNSVIQFLN